MAALIHRRSDLWSHGKWRVSTAGGDAPRWRGDGGELFYWEPAGRLMAVAVETSPPDAFRPALPRPLFSIATSRFEPFPDGQRFLLLESQEYDSLPTTVVLSWPALLERRE